MSHQRKILCLTRVCYCVSSTEDTMSYPHRILCLIRVGYYVSPTEDTMYHPRKILCLVYNVISIYISTPDKNIAVCRAQRYLAPLLYFPQRSLLCFLTLISCTNVAFFTQIQLCLVPIIYCTNVAFPTMCSHLE